MESKRLTSFSDATHKSSSKQASFQYFLHRLNSLCFCMCIKRFSRWESDNCHLKFALLTDMSNRCVIKDYFQIAKFKERVLIFFSSTAHQQVQDIYIYIWLATESQWEEIFFNWTLPQAGKNKDIFITPVERTRHFVVIFGVTYRH